MAACAVASFGVEVGGGGGGGGGEGERKGIRGVSACNIALFPGPCACRTTCISFPGSIAQSHWKTRRVLPLFFQCANTLGSVAWERGYMYMYMYTPGHVLYTMYV